MERKTKTILALALGLIVIVSGMILAWYVQQGPIPNTEPPAANPPLPPPSPTPAPKGPMYLAISGGCNFYVMAQNDLGFNVAMGGYERISNNTAIPIVGLGEYVPTSAGTFEVYSEALKSKGASYVDKWRPDQVRELLECVCKTDGGEVIAQELTKYEGRWDLARLREAAECAPALMPIYDEALKK